MRGKEVISKAQKVRPDIGWDLFPVSTCWNYFGYLDIMMFQVMTFIYFAIMTALYSILVLM